MKFLRAMVAVVATLLLAAGWFFGLVAWLEHGDDRQSNWPVAQATITASSVQPGSLPTSEDYVELAVGYSYEIDGMHFSGGQTWPISSPQVPAQYSGGSQIDVHYDPAHPSASVIVTGLPNVALFLLMWWGGLAAVVLGSVLVWKWAI
jgi:hypothetical protein